MRIKNDDVDESDGKGRRELYVVTIEFFGYLYCSANVMIAA